MISSWIFNGSPPLVLVFALGGHWIIQKTKTVITHILAHARWKWHTHTVTTPLLCQTGGWLCFNASSLGFHRFSKQHLLCFFHDLLTKWLCWRCRFLSHGERVEDTTSFDDNIMLLTQKPKTDTALIFVSLKYLIDHHLLFHSVLENISFCPRVFVHLVLAGIPESDLLLTKMCKDHCECMWFHFVFFSFSVIKVTMPPSGDPAGLSEHRWALETNCLLKTELR